MCACVTPSLFCLFYSCSRQRVEGYKMSQVKLSRNTAIITVSMRGKLEYVTFGSLKTLITNIHTINLVYCLI